MTEFGSGELWLTYIDEYNRANQLHWIWCGNWIGWQADNGEVWMS